MSAILPSLLLDTIRLGAEPDSGLAARWRAADTDGLLDLVEYEGAAIWLFRRLRGSGLLASLPPSVGDALRYQAFELAAHRLAVEAEATAVLSLLERAQVPVILIKGVARCAWAARYRYLDARATHDVDLLVPHTLIDVADAALRADGYDDVAASRSAGFVRHHHLPPLHKGSIAVELHDSTSSSVAPETAWLRASNESVVLRWGGRPVRVPSPTELAWSAIAHAMTDATENPVRGFRLDRLLELAALVSDDAPIAWQTIRDRSESHEAFACDETLADPDAEVQKWIAAAMTLVDPACRPPDVELPPFDLVELLAWRLAVFRARPRIGKRFAERLLTERARTLADLPREPSPTGVSVWGRLRRGVAGEVSRATFYAWRASRRR